VSPIISQMHEREYKRLRAEIEADYRKKLEALDLVWSMSNGATRPGQNISGRGAILLAVRTAVAGLQSTFGPPEVESSIKKNDPALAPKIRRASISNVLKKLVDEGTVEVVEKGQGRQASTYRKKPQARTG
jgi:hypothetical protein